MPDFHGFDALSPNVVDHGGPHGARLVHPPVLLDQGAIVDQIQGKAESPAHGENPGGCGTLHMRLDIRERYQ